MPAPIPIDTQILQLHNAGVPTRQIEKVIGCLDHSTIAKRLKSLTPRKTTQIYRELRADILAEKQRQILMQSDKAKPREARDLAATYAIYYDRERLERGQASQIIGHGIALSPSLQESVDKLISRVLPVDNPVVNLLDPC